MRERIAILVPVYNGAEIINEKILGLERFVRKKEAEGVISYAI